MSINVPCLSLPAVASERSERFWRRLELVPHLIGDVLRFVDLAMRTLADDSVTTAKTQRSHRHDPGFDERLGIVDGHLVQDLVALPRELLDDAHVAGMEETAASQPR